MAMGLETDRLDGDIRVDSLPRRRETELVVTELHGETIVYDRRSQDAHCLNATAALVWQYCDGQRTAPAIAALLERDHAIPAESGAVWLALEQLGSAGLLQPQSGGHGVTVSRRAVLRTVAVAGVAITALPALTSLAVPPAAAAVSAICIPLGSQGCTTTPNCCTTPIAGAICTGGVCCLPNAVACTSNGQCCSGICTSGSCQSPA